MSGKKEAAIWGRKRPGRGWSSTRRQPVWEGFLPRNRAGFRGEKVGKKAADGEGKKKRAGALLEITFFHYGILLDLFKRGDAAGPRKGWKGRGRAKSILEGGETGGKRNWAGSAS